MPDKIEKILKQIHLMFAKGEPYQGSTTDVIVNKKEVFKLLEELNYAIIEVMDTYEINELSKEQAIHRVQKDAQKIIDDASKSAEEIYAASIIYTDDALVELRDMVKKTKTSLVSEYESMIRKIDSQVDMINKNKDELHMQLADLSSGNEYLNIILDEKKRREKERDKYNRVENGETLDNTESRLTKYAKKVRSEKNEVDEPDDFSRRMSSTEVVVNVNTNHPAYKKAHPEGEEQKKTQKPEALKEHKVIEVKERPRVKSAIELYGAKKQAPEAIPAEEVKPKAKKEPAKAKKAEAPKKAPLVNDEKVKKEDLPPMKDGEYSAEDFDLDGEYFKWQDDNKETSVNADVDVKNTFLGKFFKQ